MTLTPITFLIVCPFIFLAGFVDSVAGGGGLISLPAYYLAGLPPYLAAGTNKMSACLGTVAASARFVKNGKVSSRVALLSAVAALPGSWLGTNVQLHIPENTVRLMMVCVIPVVAAVVLCRKGQLHREVTLSVSAERAISLAIGVGIGFYDGLVGPGTGTFLILLFTMLLGMDAVRASGTAKLVNLASNVAALATYTAAGDVLYGLAIPAALCAIGGGLLGASVTMKKGTGFIQKMLLVVLALLLAKMVWDVVS